MKLPSFGTFRTTSTAIEVDTDDSGKEDLKSEKLYLGENKLSEHENPDQEINNIGSNHTDPVNQDLEEDRQSESNRSATSEANEDTMGDQNFGRGFSVSRFTRGEKEDVDTFVDTIDLSFYVIKRSILEARRERAKVAYLASSLRDDAFTWWICLETQRKYTWEHAVELLRNKYGRLGIRKRINFST